MSDLQTSEPTSSPVFNVYRPNSNAPSSLPALPDDYFTPTSADLQAAQATLSARTQALVNAPLQLRSVRENNERARRERWPQTTIRVRFTDRTQLEKVFPSTDKIRSVYAFVRGCLREDVMPIKFILYQSPPKRDLKVSDLKVRDLTLAELQLAPSSILLLRFEDESLNHTTIPAPLAESVLSRAIDLPIPPADHEITSLKPNPTSAVSSLSTGMKSAEKKIPKWLKLAQKK